MAEIQKKYSDYSNQVTPEDGALLLFANAAANNMFNTTYLQLKTAILAAGIKTYSADFVSGSWTAGVIDITAATHGIGATKKLIVQVYVDGSPNELAIVKHSVFDNGDVRLETDTAFNGHYVIMGKV